MLRRSFTI